MSERTLSVHDNYFKTLSGEWGEWIPYHRAECDWKQRRRALPARVAPRYG